MLIFKGGENMMTEFNIEEMVDTTLAARDSLDYALVFIAGVGLGLAIC